MYIDAVPLLQAYAHGDCEHPRPLLDALDHGFCNVEADVWLCDGELLIAHDLCDVRSGRTLTKLYLEPLWERVQEFEGSVFQRSAPFVLLVDIKNEPEELYKALRQALEPFRAMLSSFQSGPGVSPHGVAVLLSGERPIETVSREASRLVFLDGRRPDLSHPIDPELMPWVSDNWERHFQWRGTGPLSPRESEQLSEMVSAAHASGAKLRLWSAPDEPVGWSTLLDHGVDLLSTDWLGSLKAFLLSR